MQKPQQRDHGGNLDAAVARFGGTKERWLDLSTGINPVPYPLPSIEAQAWTALPDEAAQTALVAAARSLWDVPQEMAILAVPGASAAIAQIPRLLPPGIVVIPGPTYNEHAASFAAAGWAVTDKPDHNASASVHVNPNNPDGYLWTKGTLGAGLRVIDESFCDAVPEATLLHELPAEGTIILKSFGKFWGLAGLRLGFAIGDPALIDDLGRMLGPWPVAGPALAIGCAALQDKDWATATRARLAQDSVRLDALMTGTGASLAGGTPLFRTYVTSDARAWQDRLAQARIWSRIFPYSKSWLRLGLPPAAGWDQLQSALA